MENIPTNSQQPTSENLSIGVLAMDIAWADPVANLMVVEEYLKKHASGLDVLVLPELFSTAFPQDIDVLRNIAEDDSGKTVAALKELSGIYDTALAGSYLATVDGKFYNRGFMILPDGSASFYNKRHLFGMSAESRMFEPGTELPAVVEYKGWRVALIVCYDLRFPVWCRRSAGSCQYDVLLVAANWPVSRKYAWEHLLIARAIENQAIVVGADRSGHDDFGDYDGMTYFFDTTGHPVDAENHGILSIVKVSYSALVDMRRRWPVAKDADSFCLL